MNRNESPIHMMAATTWATRSRTFSHSCRKAFMVPQGLERHGGNAGM